MQIKTTDGEQSVASSGLGNTAVTLGAIGTGLGLLNGGLSFLGNNGMNRNTNSADTPVTRYELDLIQQLQGKDIALASKDSQLALKESESYTDKKMVEVYEALKISENNLRDEVRANEKAQQIINAQQMAWNASANGTMSTLAAQIANVQSIITTVVPSSRVCDTGCCCGN